MKHNTILHAMAHNFPESIIYDNHGNTITEFSKFENYETVLRHFNLQHVKEKSAGSCT